MGRGFCIEKKVFSTKSNQVQTFQKYFLLLTSSAFNPSTDHLSQKLAT